MATRRLALMGAPVGPWVYMAQVPRPHLRVTGLKGAAITLVQHDGDGVMAQPTQFDLDGVYPITKTVWAQLSCNPPCKTAICEIVSPDEIA